MSRPAEVTTIHTRILRCTLILPDTRAYWGVAEPGPVLGQADRAFKEYWFGARSHARVAVLLANLRLRFDTYPEALAVLRAWPDMQPATRALICHWHLQLVDPLYRAFTGVLLAQRLTDLRPEISRARVVAWVGEHDNGPGLLGRWTMSTRIQFASKLLSAAAEAGILGSVSDPRPIRWPRVPDDALLYLLRLLRGVEFAGTLLDNPYLASVGLTGDTLAARLRTLPGVRYSRQGAIIDLSFEDDPA